MGLGYETSPSARVTRSGPTGNGFHRDLIRRINPLVSIVIPSKNSASTLPNLLRSIDFQTYPHHETLVVDSNSVDSTIQIANEFRCKVLHTSLDRSDSRNLGAGVARGDLFLFLDTDMELTPGVLEACVTEARNNDGLCLREVTVGEGYWAHVRAFERSRYYGSGLFEALRCFWRDVFEHLRGYDSALTGLEDYDLHARFLLAGFRLGWVAEPILHHEEGLSLRTYFEKRKSYSRADGKYADAHPERWLQQRSLTRRLRCILGKPLRPADLFLLPGLLVMRGFEWLLRA